MLFLSQLNLRLISGVCVCVCVQEFARFYLDRKSINKQMSYELETSSRLMTTGETILMAISPVFID